MITNPSSRNVNAQVPAKPTLSTLQARPVTVGLQLAAEISVQKLQTLFRALVLCARSTVADNKTQFSCRALRQHAQLKEAGRLSMIFEPLMSLLYLHATSKNRSQPYKTSRQGPASSGSLPSAGSLRIRLRSPPLHLHLKTHRGLYTCEREGSRGPSAVSIPTSS